MRWEKWKLQQPSWACAISKLFSHRTLENVQMFSLALSILQHRHSILTVFAIWLVLEKGKISSPFSLLSSPPIRQISGNNKERIERWRKTWTLNINPSCQLERKEHEYKTRRKKKKCRWCDAFQVSNSLNEDVHSALGTLTLVSQYQHWRLKIINGSSDWFWFIYLVGIFCLHDRFKLILKGDKNGEVENEDEEEGRVKNNIKNLRKWKFTYLRFRRLPPIFPIFVWTRYENSVKFTGKKLKRQENENVNKTLFSHRYSLFRSSSSYLYFSSSSIPIPPHNILFFFNLYNEEENIYKQNFAKSRHHNFWKRISINNTKRYGRGEDWH